MAGCISQPACGEGLYQSICHGRAALGLFVNQQRCFAGCRCRLGAELGGFGASQYAGIAACRLQNFALHSKQVVAEERQWLAEQLEQLELAVVPGAGNFICFRARQPLWQPMLERGILLRSCANYHGLDQQDYRICVKLRQENGILLKALREVCNGESNYDSGHHV